MECDAPPIRSGWAPDLRSILLEQLANRAADAEGAVAAAVDRIVQSPSRVPALTFNSAI